MRRLMVLLHRWFGLFAAVFLFVSGATGALIAWDHELDEWLNPQLFSVRTDRPALAPLELARRLETGDPRLQVRFMPLAVEPGHSLSLFVNPRLDPASGRPYPLDFNQVMLDPASGEILGRRQWGEISLARENLLPFLYKLHYSMHIPDGFGIQLGALFMGIVAILWVIDCLIVPALSIPGIAAWRKSFRFRWRAGGYRLNFDLHRSGGMWLYPLILMLAVTSVAMNLEHQVMRPVVGLFSPLTPSPFEGRAQPDKPPVAVRISREQVVRQAEAEAARRGWQEPVGGVFLSSTSGVYGVGFYAPGMGHGDVGLGNPWLYYDAGNGKLLADKVPGTGSGGDIFLQTMFPLHSGRIIGLPGRILMTGCGLAVAMFSVTGVVIWLRKRRARHSQALRGLQARPAAA